jgi:hypothetical protein
LLRLYHISHLLQNVGEIIPAVDLKAPLLSSGFSLDQLLSLIAVVINMFRLPYFLKSDMKADNSPKSLQKKTTAMLLFLLKKV